MLAAAPLRRTVLVALVSLAPSASTAQSTPVTAVLHALQADNQWTLEQQASICEVPAPPFKEMRRSEEYRRRFQALGLQRVRIDAVGNVYGERPGTGGEGAPTIVLAGHLDTVFPESTDVRVRREGTRLVGRGISDNCRGLAVVLAVARAFQRADPRHEARIVFVGNVGEEGPGNLRGVRYLFEREMPGEVDYFIAVDGAGLGITSRAVGSIRYHAMYKGPGGHSYGAFGIPNPVHALGRAIATIAEIQVSASPKTTFNVGVISGGTSVNSIAFEAAADIDMRSEQLESLRRLDAQVRRALSDALAEENARWPGDRAARARIRLEIDTIGVRPTGSQSDTARIVRVAVEAGRTLGFNPPTGASSTDANLPISLGIPAISIDGGGRGQGAHSLNEWYDDGTNGWLGPQWAALIVARLAGLD